MATTQSKFDLNAWFTDFAAQFQGLNPKEPGQWPLAPKLASGLAVMLVTIAAGYFLVLADVQAGLEAEHAREPQLRQDYRS
jgi:type IV pilus assembly protein PilO